MNNVSCNPLDRLTRNLAMGGGRYALYPAPATFRSFDEAQFTAAIRASNGDPIPAQLALHFDIPAAYRSSFLGVATPLGAQDRTRAEAYRDRLVRETGRVGSLFDRDRDVVGVSLAPGMTRWMTPAQVAELLESLSRHFHVKRSGIDLSMAMDLEEQAPMRDWVALGFNRISISLMAIADSEHPAVDLSRKLERAGDAGSANLRIEIPYGLPRQTDQAFDALVAAVVAFAPERIGLRQCVAPDAGETTSRTPLQHRAHARMLLAGADALEAAGYLHVGVDLFARPDDPLVVAQRRHSIHRDALGFGAHGVTHLVGFGVGAISQLGGCHAQNPLDRATWESRIDHGNLAVERGLELHGDDHVRADILQAILCHGRIETSQLALHHHIDFRAYFAGELRRLQPLFDDGTLAWAEDIILLDRIARLSSRSIAGQFDPHATARGNVAADV